MTNFVVLSFGRFKTRLESTKKGILYAFHKNCHRTKNHIKWESDDKWELLQLLSKGSCTHEVALSLEGIDRGVYFISITDYFRETNWINIKVVVE